MGILMSKLSESNMRFHGIIPGKKTKSLGQITLDVVFGDEKKFRKEKLTFEVGISRVHIMPFWEDLLMLALWLDCAMFISR